MTGAVKRPRKPIHLETARFHPARRPGVPAAPLPLSAPADGRLRRAWHTRKRIVETMIGIVQTTGLLPTMAEVARSAGISLRALFVHFPDLESLVRAGSDLVREQVSAITVSISPTAPLRQRAAKFVAYRAAFFVALGNISRVGFVLAQSFPEVRANRAAYRKAERARIESFFAPELDALSATDRGLRLAALETISDAHFWEGLKEVGGLSADEAATAVEDTLLAILRRG